MTTIDAALFAELKTIGATVTPAATVYAEGAGGGRSADPFITFARSGGTHHRVMSGGAELADYRYGLDVYSRKRATVSALVDQIREALDNRIGTIGAPAAGLEVHLVLMDAEDYLYEPDRAGAAGGWHRANLSIIVWTAETKTPVN